MIRTVKKESDFNMKKIIIISILILSFSMTLVACNEGKSNTNNNDPITQGKKIVTAPPFTVVNERDDSTANAKRYIYNIVMNESMSNEQVNVLFGFLDKPDYDEVVAFIYKDKTSANSGSYSIMAQRAGNNKLVIKRK